MCFLPRNKRKEKKKKTNTCIQLKSDNVQLIATVGYTFHASFLLLPFVKNPVTLETALAPARLCRGPYLRTARATMIALQRLALATFLAAMH